MSANPPRMVRRATEDDIARIAAIARAAYVKYVSRIGREPPPMIADFAAEIAAGHVVVIEIARAVEGYLISWPKMEAYFIDNIAVDPARQGLGLGRQLMEYAVATGDEDVDAKRSRPSIGKPASGHARKERVVLIGTDQRITSGPAARTAVL